MSEHEKVDINGSPDDDNTFDGTWFPMLRKILKSEQWIDPYVLKVWVYCLAKMKYESCFEVVEHGKGRVTQKLEPGQFIWRRKAASDELQMPPSTALKRLKKLAEKMDCLTLDPVSNLYTVVTVSNYKKIRATIFTRRSGKVTTPNGQTVTTKEQAQTPCEPGVCGMPDEGNGRNRDNLKAEKVTTKEQLRNKPILNQKVKKYKKTTRALNQSSKSQKPLFDPDPAPENPPPEKPLSGIPYRLIISDLNIRAKRDFLHTTENTRKLIKARWQEGFRFPDFQACHIAKVKEWGGDPHWSKYIRPSTLYRPSKFEGYVQEGKNGYGSGRYDGLSEAEIRFLQEAESFVNGDAPPDGNDQGTGNEGLFHGAYDGETIDI